MNYDENSWKNNRIKTKQPRGRSFWCNYCDGYKVMASERCKVCNKKSGKYRCKKHDITQ